ncbi:hypothetical protein FANTH_14742 [Fusarium anthophilum]|uniref:BTB domain-containing protein n=1 Tax=Fusarium anthophilum TaxID=48485 RepID=A0A8H4YGF9_9HYPO|nr:hypothetical protein FANTH_14742 [Fusarium anthophilum]
MAILYENIDPDGDTLIIISYPSEASQGAGEPAPVSEEIAVAEPEVADEPLAIEDTESVDYHTISSEIVQESSTELRLKVSKKHLTVAARRARIMFEGEYRETQKSKVDGFYHWPIQPLFDSEAVKIVMKIIHAQTQDLPDEVTLEMIVSIAEVVDDLQCHEALSFFVKAWIGRLFWPIPISMCDEVVQWIFIASVFGLDEKFKEATRVAVMHSTGPIDSLGLPMRPDILDKIEQKRQETLEELTDQLHGVLDNLCSGRACHVFACRSMMLGALTQDMHKKGLGSPRPARPFNNMSLFSTLETVRQLESPMLYLSPEDDPGSMHDPSYGKTKDVSIRLENHSASSVWKKKHRKELLKQAENAASSHIPKVTAHLCCLQDILKPGVDGLEARVEGLSLDH